ncbi:MAG: TetR/AcrR family transcriptional regulator [Acidothermaceae bacterium]
MTASSIRQQRAQGTRQRICDAAKELFLRNGYAASTITEIASAAGVAHQTVYFIFGSKAAVLSAIVDTEIVGDVAAVPLLDRPHIRRIAQLSDPLQRLRRIVSVTCDITARLAPLYEIVRSGAADGEVRDVLDRHEEQRWQTMRAFAAMLDGELAPGLLLDDAAERLYVLLSHEVHWLLVHTRRRSPTQWRQYVAAEAARQLLPAPAGQ